jgi:hypothetical protein
LDILSIENFAALAAPSEKFIENKAGKINLISAYFAANVGELYSDLAVKALCCFALSR